MQLLQSFTEQPEKTPYDVVKAYWNTQHTGADFEAWWRRAVHDGVVPDSALPREDAWRSAGRRSARAREPCIWAASWK